MKITSVSVCSFVWLYALFISARDAYVVVPVADLVGEPLPTSQTYSSIPLSPFEKEYDSCQRIHQLLYHERVRLVETQGDQVLIEVPNVFYSPAGTKKKVSIFWTLKKYVVPVDAIQGDISNLPLPFSSACAPQQGHKMRQVTLTLPYSDPISGMTFSAGTVFISVCAKKNRKKYTVYYVHPTTHRIETTTLPARHCIDTTNYTNNQRRDLFVQLIRAWIPQSVHGYIPYVWGGTSIGHPTDNQVKVYQHAHSKKQGRCYDFVENQNSIKVGCDCSGLILRAAHLCGIPYFFKNSYTAACSLQSVGDDHALQQGDILWVPGHVMIVADLSRNTIFEQRSYDHGYGKLQELPLCTVFKGINTFEDIRTAHRQKLPLYRMDSTGTVRDTFSNFKILSLASVWDLAH